MQDIKDSHLVRVTRNNSALKIILFFYFWVTDNFICVFLGSHRACWLKDYKNARALSKQAKAWEVVKFS